MAELGSIKVFLFLLLELHVTVIANVSSVIKRAGDQVMLSCENVTEGQFNCNGTIWILSGPKSKEVVALVTYGQVEGNTRAGLIVTPNCSLVIKNIKAEDVGRYECQQYKYEYKRGEEKLVHRSVINLSVITMTEHKENQTVTLNCSVNKSGSCKDEVKWLFNHQEVDKKKMKTSATYCSANVTFLDSFLLNSSSVDQLFQCEVIPDGNKKRKLFTLSHQSSGATAAPQEPTTRTEDTNPMKTTPGSTPYIAVAVGLVIVLAIAVVVIGWRAKRNKTRRDENMVDEDVDDGVSYASIRYPRDNSSEVQVHGDPDKVTYSTVRSPYPSTATSDDHNNVYSLLTLK
ncbi:uncharacterized protein LOC110367478 [Fundulus heteroclitus]|uniref:uncharacterized protein LOC110367478 n=1 Tax=Fundulus heteroclitus TaxID=8078 RepID=UPI00165A8CC3|nr:uncharacterized protein LOC110367478 [Fundulus heteroclitus]